MFHTLCSSTTNVPVKWSQSVTLASIVTMCCPLLQSARLCWWVMALVLLSFCWFVNCRTGQQNTALLRCSMFSSDIALNNQSSSPNIYTEYKKVAFFYFPSQGNRQERNSRRFQSFWKPTETPKGTKKLQQKITASGMFCHLLNIQAVLCISFRHSRHRKMRVETSTLNFWSVAFYPIKSW